MEKKAKEQSCNTIFCDPTHQNLNAKFKPGLFARLDCNTVAIADPMSSPQRELCR